MYQSQTNNTNTFVHRFHCIAGLPRTHSPYFYLPDSDFHPASGEAKSIDGYLVERNCMVWYRYQWNSTVFWRYCEGLLIALSSFLWIIMFGILHNL